MGGGFCSATLQLRKRHYDSLELDASQMEVRPREEVVFAMQPLLSASPTSPALGRPLGRMGYAQWVAF